ncbi:MAG: glycosyltransferase family 2 protein [Limnobacter sp.]|uniref:glycosyltransferase family 2 protein n=1 Tax=Limnobacter sp. TaxID=2003368 RepID=UPI00391B42DE
MEAIDWDVYAKSYEDTQHLVGRPDLAQKHYDLIGRDQGRDHGFNPLLVFCLYDDVQTLDDARKAVLRDPARYPIRSRLALKQAVASFPTLVGLLPKSADYLLEPAVDAFLFQIQLEQRKIGVNSALDGLVQEVTNELLADLSVEREQVLKALPKAESPLVAGAVVSRRDSVVKVAQKAPYVVRVEALIPVLQGAAYLVLGYVFDPEQQWSGFELQTDQKTYNIFPLLKRFVWHSKAQVLLDGGIPGDYLEPDVGFAALIHAEKVEGTPMRVTCTFKDAEVLAVQPPMPLLNEIDQAIIPVLWTLFHGDLFECSEGRLELLDSVFLDKRVPQQARKSPFRLGLDHVFKLQRNLLISGHLLDTQQALKALYLRLSSGRCMRLDETLVRTPRPDLSDEAQAFGVPEETTGFCAFTKDVFVDDQGEVELIALLDSGEWICDNTSAEVANPATTRSLLLDQWNLQMSEHSRGMLVRVIEPVFPLLAEARRAQIKRVAPTVSQFGSKVARPEVSIVVYCSGNGDELKYLLSSVKLEASKLALEVVVVADVHATQKLERLLKVQADMLGLSIQLIGHQGHLEYGSAINFAAEHCAGRFLCLLDSSVMPTQGAWLSTLLQVFKSKPNIGLLAPRLLNLDGMVQSAGVRFVPETHPVALWAGDSPCRGLPVNSVSLPDTYEMPAVTLECALLERKLFLGLSGFDITFSEGRLEAADLCLRIWQADRTVVVSSNIDMTQIGFNHLSDIDNPDYVHKEMLANRRLQHNRWATFIDQRFQNWQAGTSSSATFRELDDTMKNVLGGFV